MRCGRYTVWMAGALLIAGCGGGATPEPATQEDAKTETASESPEEAPKGDTADKPSEKTADEPTDAKSESSSADVLNVVLQRVIEDEELDKFLHLQSPGRFPLKIAGKDLPSGVSLTKAGQPVAVVEAPSSKKDAVLVFTQIEVSAKDATIGYRYDVEGIRGTARVKKTDHGWELSSSRIVEH